MICYRFSMRSGNLSIFEHKLYYSELQSVLCDFAGPVATELYTTLTDVQQEKTEDKYGWVFAVK